MKEEALDERTLLSDLGFTKYEIDAYLATLSLGVCEARDICRRSGVPTSKVYDVMARLEALGLVEVQASRPRRFAPVDPSVGVARLIEHKRKEIREFEARIPALETRLRVKARANPRDSIFWSVAASFEEFVVRHLAKLVECEKEFVTITPFHGVVADLLGPERGRRKRTPAERALLEKFETMVETVKVHVRSHQIPYRNLVTLDAEDLPAALAWTERLTDGRNLQRYRFTTDRLPQGFHVIDGEKVILLLNNPARPAEILGSVFIHDRGLAEEITKSFDEAWARAASFEAAKGGALS
ncbi:MAG: TrmB family transcriptional regulator [Methanobacteriota archaeon]